MAVADVIGEQRPLRRRSAARRRSTASGRSTTATTSRASSSTKQSPPRSTVPRGSAVPNSTPPSVRRRPCAFSAFLPAERDRVARDTPRAACPAGAPMRGQTRSTRQPMNRELGTPIRTVPNCRTSEQKIPLRQRQHVRRLARQQLAVGAHLVGLGVRPRSSAARRSAPDRACRCVRQPRTATGGRASPSSAPPSMPGLADEMHAARVRAPRRSAPNIGRAITGCGVGIDALPSPIIAPAMKPPLMTSSGLTPKNAGFHSTRSASLPTSIEPTSRRDAVRDRRVDRVFRDVAAHAQVVVAGASRPAAARAAASSCRRSARCGRSPRRCGPSPASRTTSC